MKQIVGFDQLDRHQEALAGLTRDARVSAQLEIRTTTGFDQGQSHPLAAFQARNLGGLKMCTGWGWHHARSVVGGSAIVLLTDGSRDRAAIDQSYTFTHHRTPSNSKHAAKVESKSPDQSGLFADRAIASEFSSPTSRPSASGRSVAYRFPWRARCRVRRSWSSRP